MNELDDRIAWSVPEAAKKIGISKALLWREISRGCGPPVKKICSRTLILKSDLLAWLQSIQPETEKDKAHED